MSPRPTLGVVIPTLNCASLLEGHLNSLESWLDTADEIVVVDSHSEDGTWEIVRSRLAGPKTFFYQRPKGLYQAWNYGVSRLSTQLTYFSTVGDHITKDGLEHLRQVANSTVADVVISPPAFVEEQGSPAETPPHWPVQELIQVLEIKAPRLIDDWILLLLSLENPVDAILGSSASNIYRTAKLQERPFPTNYGSVGDGAWGIGNIFNYRLAVTPECFSLFREHPKSYSINTYAVSDLDTRLFDLLVENMDKLIRSSSAHRKRAETLKCRELAQLVKQRMTWQKKLETTRHATVPWLFNPQAWRSRKMRNHFRTAARECRDAALEICRLDAMTSSFDP
jgi:glycosyltransferase involved in cell wall biosynthesis